MSLLQAALPAASAASGQQQHYLISTTILVMVAKGFRVPNHTCSKLHESFETSL